ncbi:hypothetical protein HWHPT5561_06585 [Petrotoga sp. HWH.PT.55.6.1]|uniref:polysaccharide pyruvyl transferase family protein n=1 Tax=unclassified Petrotoga TaxID=2620614 RepID=UPI000CA034CC|nr:MULTISPECIES: polysaccharide pyruvyl transferase family protein [unclassified Petrotoga]PNR91840.1 hypothetical protein X926_07880 [Petrotoga sp. HWHPT.55.6.3]RPD35594.1 hypothetical protein HWHPT5561_06585 [Petrotoga sp. HWH.PT.55.6.1]
MEGNHKKIGIATLTNYFNYGNRLQNYALQEILKPYSKEVETLVIPKNSTSSRRTKHYIKKLFSQPLSKTAKTFASKINWKIKYLTNKDILIERERRFKDFSQNYIKERHFRSLYETNEISDEFDYVFTGSDQVWNPYFIKNREQYYFLQFVEEEKRIAYAPSFGISEIPQEVKQKYKEWLSSIPYISVREKEGARIIKELTGRDVPVLVDPTLLLNKEEWIKIAKEHKNKPKSKYLICYFWGKIPKERKTLIKRIAEKYNLQIINIANLSDKKTYTADPSEFIDYINSASLVLTDSYHGSAFSILMETPFFVFERIGGPSMYSRIRTLLEKTKLKNREEKDIDLNKNLLEMDFSHVHSILNEERKKSFDFLKKAMRIE